MDFSWSKDQLEYRDAVIEFAKKEVTLLRIESGTEQRTRIDYKRLLAGDSSVENIYLKAGDTLLFN